jgi:hypothetical protein
MILPDTEPLLQAGWKSSAGNSKGVLCDRYLSLQLTLPSLLLEIRQGLGHISKQRKGIRGRLREFGKATSTQDSLTGYKTSLNELRSNFTV